MIHAHLAHGQILPTVLASLFVSGKQVAAAESQGLPGNLLELGTVTLVIDATSALEVARGNSRHFIIERVSLEEPRAALVVAADGSTNVQALQISATGLLIVVGVVIVALPQLLRHRPQLLHLADRLPPTRAPLGTADGPPRTRAI